MRRLWSICKKIGCNKLIRGIGFCDDHKRVAEENKRAAWERLDQKKPADKKAFYNSHIWHKTSKRHRIKEPLCRRCKVNGKVVAGVLVHHNPPLDDLWAQGLNPYLDDYLETLCFSCHQKELRKKSK